MAARVVDNSFYMDDGPINDSVDEVIELQKQMQRLFDHGGFTLRKIMSSSNFVSYMLFLKPQSILRPLGVELEHSI